MGYLELEPWSLLRFPTVFFPIRVFSGRFFLSSVLTVMSVFVNSRSALFVMLCAVCLDVIRGCSITYCYSSRCQNKPNSFCPCSVLRGGAVI